MRFLPFLLLLHVKTISADSEVNLARGGAARQSTTYEAEYASRGIDGSRANNFWERSCTHTELTADPWWRVDLRDSYYITSIRITNRRDCCPERLDGAQIRIGESSQNDGKDNPVVATIVHIPAGRTETFTLSEHPMGRYVYVVLPGSRKYLTLCEVEVFGYQDEKNNVALRGEATQIDTYDESGAASNAIDGNRDPVYSHKSCAHTLTTTNPWWRVDLHHTYAITSITVKNRGDCCAQRLDGAQIRVGDSSLNNGNDNPVVATISHIPLGISKTFHFSQTVEGRYVNVYLPGVDKYLTLCEVEIYGDEVERGESRDN